MGAPFPGEVRAFTYRLKHLGAQWVDIDGRYYLCHTPVSGHKEWFIATTPQDHRAYRVNPFGKTVEAIESHSPTFGEILPCGRSFSMEAVIQAVAEAHLRDSAIGIAYYANYVVTVYACARLVLADDFSAGLISRLLSTGTGLAGEIAVYEDDQIGSPRIRTAWVAGVVELTKNFLLYYPED